MAGDGVQATDLKRVGKAVPKVYVHKDGKTIMIPAEKKDEYMAKGYKLSSLRAEDDNSSKGGKEGFDYPQGGKYGYKAERGSGTGAMGTMQVNVTIHNRETDEIHIVDYKSTAGRRNEEGTALNPISLVGTYKEAYKNQMDIYQWILTQEGFNVSNWDYETESVLLNFFSPI